MCLFFLEFNKHLKNQKSQSKINRIDYRYDLPNDDKQKLLSIYWWSIQKENCKTNFSTSHIKIACPKVACPNKYWCVWVNTRKNLYPLLWLGLKCLKARDTSRRQFTFRHYVPRDSWYLFYRPRKDEHPVVFFEPGTPGLGIKHLNQ